jgi:tRNA (guanine-N7-)-methyltransferase
VAKKKLIHFQENLTFPFLFQPPYPELYRGFGMQGNWKREFFRNSNPLIVELGCGKGEYTVGLAENNSNKNYIGIDIKGARLWRGCKSVVEQQLSNVAFVRTRVDHLCRIFGPGEVQEIWITFPDPQAGKERLRLTSAGFLEKYRQVLSPGGIIHLKTDDEPFFRYTLEVVKSNNHRVLWETDDLYQSGCEDEVVSIQTYYESIWLAMNKKINYLRFQL